jgi:hypothetical protein
MEIWQLKSSIIIGLLLWGYISAFNAYLPFMVAALHDQSEYEDAQEQELADERADALEEKRIRLLRIAQILWINEIELGVKRLHVLGFGEFANSICIPETLEHTSCVEASPVVWEEEQSSP